MSASSLWLVNQEMYGSEEVEYRNSWLVTPIVANCLLHKYTRETGNFMSSLMFNKHLFGELNQSINQSKIQIDRVLWELANQQAFYSKDKMFVAKCVREFLPLNEAFDDLEKKEPLGDHIHERFEELAKDIESIDETKYPLFIFKSTDCDDGVKLLFQRYDEEEEDYRDSKLTDNKDGAIFANRIEDGKIVEFVGIDKLKEEFEV